MRLDYIWPYLVSLFEIKRDVDQWGSRTFGRPVRMSNFPPLRLQKCWKAYSTIMSTFSRVA